MLDMQKRLSTPFTVLMTLPASAIGFSLAVQISALSWLLHTKFDLEIEEIGLVWAAGPLAGIIGQVIIGVISDKVWFWGGRRRPFILIGGFLSALSLLALPNIGVISDSLGMDGVVAVALVVALTLDLSVNVGFNPTRSIIADLTPDGEPRTRGFTWMQTVSGSFGVLAYFIGGSLGNEFLIYFGAVLVLLGTCIPPFFLEEPRQLAEPAAPDAPQLKDRHGGDFGRLALATMPLWAVFAYDAYALTLRLLEIERHSFAAEWITLAATAVLITIILLRPSRSDAVLGENMGEFQKIMAAHSFSWIGVQTMFIYMFSFLEQRLPTLDDDGLGSTISYSFLILNLVAAILPALVLAPLAKTIRRVRLHAACLAVMAGAYAAGYVFGYSVWVIYIVMALLGVGWAAIVSLPFAIMSMRINKTRMGLYMGIFNLSVVLPQLVASLGIGLALDRLEDQGWVFLIGAVSLAVSAVLWLAVKPLPAGSEGAAAQAGPETGSGEAGGGGR